jgi:imidazolonepropionase
MTVTSLTITNAKILTLAGPREPRRQRALRDLRPIDRGYVRIDDGRITAVERGDPPANHSEHIDARGAVVMPAYVDCHTHACWAGDRLDEFEMSLRGATYLEILKAGGGIMSTVRAVRKASEDELTELLLKRLARMSALGTATAEVKSGYGLAPEAELKMLRAIRSAAWETDMTVVPTFLGAHAMDPENPQCVEQTINETLPAVVQEFPGITCDAFCERGAWSLHDTRRLFENARDMGCPIRVHTDQFNSLGMTRLAVEMGAISVDHLEAVTPKDLEHLARSRTMAVMMPCTGFNLDDRYAPARELIDTGVAVAIATNYNPGSSPTPSMPFAIGVACRKLKISPAEAIMCSTFNAACVLGLQDEIGSIEVGKRADLQVLDGADERELAHELAAPGPRYVIIDGKIVHSREQPQQQRA